MIDLDDQSVLLRLDPQDMLGAVEAQPNHWRNAVEIADGAGDLPESGDLDNLVVCGMGGSGISGDILAAVASPRLSVPVMVVKGYRLPEFVGRHSLVLAMSYSGNTEETLESVGEALARGARAICVTTGGAMGALAEEQGLATVKVPTGMQPRASVWYLAVPLLVVLERMGIMPSMRAQLEEAHRVLAAGTESMGRRAPEAANPAKALARKLLGRIPLIYGSDGLPGVAALRWKCQWNENAKAPAFFNVFPELNHNEIVGLARPAQADERLALVALRDPGEHARVTRRIAVTLDLVASQVGLVEQVRAEGESALARFASLVQMGDFASVYLALLRGQDPTPVQAITTLKNALAR
ncbi:MAG: bifunctional phosphoglucose/phosphomannose isomerase [Actinomycetota bacterium]